MKTSKDIQNILTQILHWAKSQDDIKGVALIGSYARDMAKNNSDIDLVLVVKNYKNYLHDLSWLNHFGIVQNVTQMNDSKMTSLQVDYLNSYPIEFCITTSAWTKIPPDRSSVELILNGIKI